MTSEPQLVSLGFTDEKFPVGTHICQIYSDDDERDESLLKFLLSGLESDEQVACFSDKMNESAIAAFLEAHAVSLNDAKDSGRLNLSGNEEVYFVGDKFDQERLLARLMQFQVSAKQAGCAACRVIGEMSPKIQDVEGGSRLLEYESRVTLLLKEHPITAVCQYNATEFDGATIMDVLKVHPMMIVRGAVIKNPFFIPPEQLLKQLSG